MEDFVTIELAKKLKEKGFSEKCLYHYFDNKLVANTCKSDNDNITTEDLLMSCNYLVSQFDTVGSNVVVSDAPTISQVLKWLREETKINVNMRLYKENGWYYTIQNYKGEPLYSQLTNTDELYPSYEEAALVGIEYVINNLI